MPDVIFLRIIRAAPRAQKKKNRGGGGGRILIFKFSLYMPTFIYQFYIIIKLTFCASPPIATAATAVYTQYTHVIIYKCGRPVLYIYVYIYIHLYIMYIREYMAQLCSASSGMANPRWHPGSGRRGVTSI